MDEYNEKESYPGYFAKIMLQMADRFGKGLLKLKAAGVDLTDRGNMYSWAAENITDLRNEEKDLGEKIRRLMVEGEMTARFNADCFTNYQEVVREWGSVTNKIFNRFFKHLKALRQAQDEVDEVVEMEEQKAMGF